MAVTLVYLLRLARDVLFGPARSSLPFADLDARETTLLCALALCILLLGLFPGPVLALAEGPLHLIAAHVWPAATPGL